MKKPIYNIYTLTARLFVLTLSLASVLQTQGSTTTTKEALDAATVEGLQVQLVSPNTFGVANVPAWDGEGQHPALCYTINEGALIVYADALAAGRHRLTVKSQFGTQVYVLAIFDLVVAENLPAGEDGREAEIVIVKTVGDGSGVQITVDQEIIEDSTNPVAGGAVYTALAGKQPAGNYQPAGTYADGTVYTKEDGEPAHVAGAVTCGANNVADPDGDYLLIVGNGADAEHKSNAFAIDKNGNLVLFNAGTPVVLTPAKLAQLIA